MEFPNLICCWDFDYAVDKKIVVVVIAAAAAVAADSIISFLKIVSLDYIDYL